MVIKAKIQVLGLGLDLVPKYLAVVLPLCLSAVRYYSISELAPYWKKKKCLALALTVVLGLDLVPKFLVLALALTVVLGLDLGLESQLLVNITGTGSSAAKDSLR